MRIKQIGIYVSNELNNELLGLAELLCSKFIEYLKANGLNLTEKITTINGNFLMVNDENKTVRDTVLAFAEDNDLDFLEISRYADDYNIIKEVEKIM